MPKFETADPAEIHVGRGRLAHEQRLVYRENIRGNKAGIITLERGDRPATVKRLLSEAAKAEAMRVRSSFDDAAKPTKLMWKIVGA